MKKIRWRGKKCRLKVFAVRRFKAAGIVLQYRQDAEIEFRIIIYYGKLVNIV